MTCSEHLQAELAEWTMMLANTLPNYATYHALNTAQMLATDKEPGICPMARGEIEMQLLGHCIIDTEVKLAARDACRNANLCAGPEASIKGNLHKVRVFWPKPAGWVFDERMIKEPNNLFQQLIDGVQQTFGSACYLTWILSIWTMRTQVLMLTPPTPG